jgi:hypothetical protein
VQHTRFNDAYARKDLKRTTKDSKPFYELTAQGLRNLKNAAPEDIRTPQQVIEAFNERQANPRRRTVKGGAPMVRLNPKGNSAVDSLAKLLEDYNASLQMLAMIQAQIGDFLKDNQPTE